jgi:cobalt-zinc-cadmium efflux system outer membrane protein
MLRLVAERSPRLAAERVAIDAAEAERIGAAAYPNPTVSVGRYKPAGGARTVFDASSQSQTTLDFPVLIGGQRKARMDAAERAVDLARAQVGVASHEAVIKAMEAFVGLQSAQEKARVLEAAYADVQRLSKVVAERMASGMASRYEATRAEIELASLKTRLDDAYLERSARASELAAMIGAPGWKPVALGTPTSNGIAFDHGTLAAAVKDGNAQLLAARRDEAAAQAAVTRAQRERLPVPVVSVGRTWTGDPYGAANFVGLSAEIPILDRRMGPVVKAEAELRAAQLRREAIEVELDAELARALDMLAARRATLAQFDRSIGSKLDALRQMSEDYYQLGRGSILELVDAARSRLESALNGLDVRAQLVTEELRLLALSGKLAE